MQVSETQQEREGEGAYISLFGRFSLCLIAPLSGLAQAGLAPVLPKISEHFASTPDADTLVRLMVSALSFAMILGSLGAGLLAARIGQRTLLFICLGLYAVAGAAGFFLDNLYLLVASRMVLGVVTAAWGVLIAAVITTQIAPAIRDRWLGFYIVSGTLGMFVLMVAIGVLGSLNWRFVFLLYLLAFPAMLLVSVTVRMGPSKAVRGADKPIARVKRGIPFGITLFSIVCGAVGPTIMIFLPFHLLSIGDGAPGQVASVVVATAIATGLVAFAYGWIRARLSVLIIFVVGFGLAALGTFTIVAIPTYMGAVIGIVIFGIGGGFLHPNLFAAAAASAPPEDRARIIGYARAGVYAGPLLAQIPLEFIAHGLGATAAIAGIAVMCVGAVAWAVIGRRAYAPAA